MRLLLSALLPLAHAYPLSKEKAKAAYPQPHELYYQQKLDHFNPADHRRWSHRVLLNNESWDGSGRLQNGCRGPILLYTGNEGPIDAFWKLSGFVVEVLAPKLGALLLFPEERYYGKSLPFGAESFAAENIHYLTTAQVLEDYAEIVAHFKATLPEASNCPVVAFGGSYGGTLTALLRASHPATIIGGLAASSELGYYDKAAWSAHGVDEFTFEDVVTATWDAARPGCMNAIKATIRAIDDSDEAHIVQQFQVCEPRVLGPGPKSTLFAYVLEGMPQGDYPSLGFPVSKACDVLLEAQNTAADASGKLVEAAAKIVKEFYSFPSCIPYDVGGPGNTPGDGPSASAWGYQSCTETLHAFSARTIRNYTFDYGKSASSCGGLYNRTVKPDLAKLANEFGGAYALAEGTAGVSHLIWSQGTLDPWHGWFKQMASPSSHLEVYHILMKDSAHHTDLRSPSDADPKSVTDAREAEERIIRGWIAEASSSTVVV